MSTIRTFSMITRATRTSLPDKRNLHLPTILVRKKALAFLCVFLNLPLHVQKARTINCASFRILLVYVGIANPVDTYVR